LYNGILRYQNVIFIIKEYKKVMNRTIVFTGLLLGALAIALGAFGAHGLGKIVDLRAVGTFEVGVRYQMYHALFLLVLGCFPILSPKTKKRVFLLVLTGVVLFSFSIYLLSLNSLFAFDIAKMGILTPIGGLFLIGGWLYTGVCLLTQKQIN